MEHEDPKTENITAWPPPLYRDWVQTQIANKMLLRLGGLGIVSVIVVVVSYFLAQNFVLDNIRPKIEKAVYDSVRQQTTADVQNEVLRQLVGQPELLEALKERITKGTHIDAILKSAAFTEPATARLIKLSEETNLVQGVILREALKRVWTKDATVASRALGRSSSPRAS